MALAWIVIIGFILVGLTAFAVFGWSNLKAKLEDTVVTSNDTAVLCIGMNTSKSAGKCPGAGIDATRMYSLLKPYASGGITLLQDSQATYAKVLQAFQNAVKHDLCILFYSGHGGRDEKDNKNAANETDKRDEYLCLYDKFMKDDVVWNVILQAKKRVVCIFDCCHSGTMYRALDRDDPKFSMYTGDFPFTLRRFSETGVEKRHRSKSAEYVLIAPQSEPQDRREDIEAPRSSPNLLCWSAAKEDQYSYGGDSGGVFTNKLISVYSKNSTYAEVWKRVVNSMKKEPNTPVQTKFGKGFKGKVFK